MPEYTAPEQDRVALLTINGQEDFAKKGSHLRARGVERARPALRSLVEAFRGTAPVVPSFITRARASIRTGLSKVGLPGAELGMQEKDPTIAGLLKDQGYATGQFGKNHLGDKDEHLPTNHGFDEFFGNLYHLNAEEEPENEDYPKDPEFRERFGPRGVIKSSADGKIEDTGPLTKKRMETVDDETVAAAIDFIERAHAAGKPFFVLVERHPHALSAPTSRTRAARHLRPGRVRRRHGRARHAHRPVPRQARRARHRRQHHRPLLDRQRPAHEHLAGRGGQTPFQGEKNTNWEGGWRVPALVRWPGKIEPGSISNEIVHHMDWLPTFLAAAGKTDIKEQAAGRRRQRGDRPRLQGAPRRLQHDCRS